eukprot:NODE_6194_length_1695_cov_20.278061.p1 GENE.NODE_6194_length_1695_cov_20.278061~~NODE_6194_length_1695_cov_20.278061.p1  ORF type:complete len:386 (-),score=74.62 NODE_6194_length_1695_cov_20.278061:371-1528(-)
MGTIAGVFSSDETLVSSTRNRMRLTLESVNDEEEVTEENRRNITRLFETSVEQLLGEEEEVLSQSRFCIRTCDDSETGSFLAKQTSTVGVPVDPVTLGIGFTCRKGLKPESPNQDSLCVMRIDNGLTMYGVFDGHGKHGHIIADIVKEYLPVLFLENRASTPDLSALLAKCFQQMQQTLIVANQLGKAQAMNSGTTATLVLHSTFENKLYIAHVGDSTCVKVHEDMSGTWVGEATTVDHKPNIPAERQRIEAAGGRVIFDGNVNHRVYVSWAKVPGLSMSRCFGDLHVQRECGVTAEPELTEVHLTEQDKAVLICSDGVWEFINANEAAMLVHDGMGSPADAGKASFVLAQEAWNRWISNGQGTVVDDITVLMFFLQDPQHTPAI